MLCVRERCELLEECDWWVGLSLIRDLLLWCDVGEAGCDAVELVEDLARDEGDELERR